MAENIGGPSAPYNTQIPSIADDADIQTAFRLYHYGSNTSTPSTILANSIAGHLDNLEETKIDIVPEPLALDKDPDTVEITGFYVQPGTPISGTYPALLAGLLTVVNNGATIFQQYQVIGGSETGATVNPANKIYWRHKVGGSWRPWRTYIDDAAFTAKGDLRYVQGIANISNYYTKTEVNNFLAPIPSTYLTIAEADTRSLITENVQTAPSGEYVLQLSDRNKVVAMNNSAPAIVRIPTHESMGASPFPIGSIVNVYAASNQTITIAGESGVDVRNAGQLFERYVEVSLRKRANNEWVASGNIIPV
jgi:hypothetical protein